MYYSTISAVLGVKAWLVSLVEAAGGPVWKLVSSRSQLSSKCVQCKKQSELVFGRLYSAIETLGDFLGVLEVMIEFFFLFKFNLVWSVASVVFLLSFYSQLFPALAVRVGIRVTSSLVHDHRSSLFVAIFSSFSRRKNAVHLVVGCGDPGSGHTAREARRGVMRGPNLRNGGLRIGV
jgi:hypothetical protein